MKIKLFNFSGASKKDEVILKRHDVHLSETRSNIINFMRDFERMEFEKVEDDEDSGFYIQEKSSNKTSFEEEIDEDITVISINNKETGDSKIAKSTNIVLKEGEYEVEAVVDYKATVSSTLVTV